MHEKISMKSVMQDTGFLKQLKHARNNREYLLYVPPSYSHGKESPVVLNFHGFGSAASDYMHYSDWRNLSDENGFLLIYPQGLELENGGSHWNPDPISSNSKSSSDDLGFVDKIIKRISKKYSLDTSRVYATGFSNGAGMAYGLARYRSDLMAGVAPVSGLSSYQQLSTHSEVYPVGLISFNGSEDWIRPVAGIEGYLASVAEVSSYWSKINDSDESESQIFKQRSGEDVEKSSYTRDNGLTTIDQYIIKRGGHEWFDLNIENKNLNQLAWDFLSRLSKRDGKLEVTKGSYYDVFVPKTYRRKLIDKIINFKAYSDMLRIDISDFGIEKNATFVSGKNKAKVKNKLAEKNFDFLYDQKKGSLYFNENRSEKGFGNGGIVAILRGAPVLTTENIDFI